MAYERLWQFMPMQGPYVPPTPAQINGHAAWQLKTMLTGQVGGITQGLWTVYASCDSVTAGYDGPGTDRWGGNTFDTSKVVGTSSPFVAHSWIVLKRDFTVYSTTYTVYLTILATDYQNNGTAGIVSVFGALAAPTGGSPTTDPTQHQQFFSCNTNVSSQFGADTSNNRRSYGAMTSVGDFWFAETIQGEVNQGFLLQQPAGCKTNDQCPFFMSGVTLHNSTINQNPFMGPNLFSRASGAGGLGQMPGMYYNGSTGYPALIQPPPYAFLDVTDVSLFDFPAWVVVGNAATPTASHARGRLVDMGLCSGYNASGQAYSAYRPCNVGTTIRDITTAVKYVTLNQLIVPYNDLLS